MRHELINCLSSLNPALISLLLDGGGRGWGWIGLEFKIIRPFPPPLHPLPPGEGRFLLSLFILGMP